jgi:3-oxoacyl-[acyl-carrier protein] reductase
MQAISEPTRGGVVAKQGRDRTESQEHGGHTAGGPQTYHGLLAGRRALVTGAAGGIGSAVSRYVSAAGAQVAGVSRSAGKLEELAASLPGPGGLEPVVLDLGEPGAPAACVAAAAEALGGIDIVVNNAGIASPAAVEKTDLELWERHMHLNAAVPFLLTRAALPHLRQSAAPEIVNMGSVVSHKGYTEQGAYAASKHALFGLTKVLARELHEEGIRVHFVSPGGVATGMIENVRPDIDPEKLIRPEEIADVILFLLTRRGRAGIDEIAVRRAASQPWK